MEENYSLNGYNYVVYTLTNLIKKHFVIPKVYTDVGGFNSYSIVVQQYGR